MKEVFDLVFSSMNATSFKLSHEYHGIQTLESWMIKFILFLDILFLFVSLNLNRN